MHEHDKQMLADHYLDFYTIAFDMLHNQADVEDAVQDALATTMSRIFVKDPCKYCARVVYNNCLQMLQRKKYILTGHLPDIYSEDEEKPNIHDIQLAQLWKLKDQLPPRILNVINLYYVKGYTKEEIAKRTSYSVPLVNKLIRLGHQRLREQMLQKKEHSDRTTNNNI